VLVYDITDTVRGCHLHLQPHPCRCRPRSAARTQPTRLQKTPLALVYTVVAVVRGSMHTPSSVGSAAQKFCCFIEDHVWFEDRWMVASLCDE
jgi:hypothetical protein